MKKIVFLFCILLSANLYAKLMMGEWQMHCAYNDVQQIEQSADKVYAVSDGTLFSVDKRDETIEYYTKLSGLNSTNITCIKYDKDTKTLLIIYENGNIDLLKDGGVENISDLYNKIMNASKAVNDAVFHDHNAYLATDFGVLVLNINKHEIANTCYIGAEASEVQVKCITFVGDVVYAATSSAIYYANVKNDNIVDFSYWKTINTLPVKGTITNIASFNNKLYVLMSNQLLYAFNGNSWTSVFPSMPLTSISTSGDHFFASTPTGCYNIHTDYSLDTISVFYNAAEIEMDETTHTYWFAARTDGIGMYKYPTINKYLPDGPIVNIPYNMRFAGEKLFVVPGGRWTDRYNRAPYVMIYENGEWTNINATKTKMPDGVYPTDFVNVAIDPKDDDHFFVTSYGMGVLEYQGTEFIQQYSYNNSLLYPAAPTNPKYYTRTCGAICDNEGNLWVCNSSATFSMVVFSPDMTKQATLGNTTSNTPGEIILDKNNNNYKWMSACRGINIGLELIDDNGTPFDTNDDKEIFRKKFHDQNHKEVAPEYIYCITQDNKGDIWVGTYDGLFYISANTDFFQSDAVNRVLIPRNDGSELYDYLLNGEQINAIAIDGANRKWIGTASSGIYLMSEDGVETIEHFTSDNSPLPSNNILSIAINPVTGEVFMGTGSGLVSYQSDAIEGNKEFTDVYVYPNPIRADYTGLITITGLIDNTNVKITDIAGNLIYEAISNGGIAVWDGKDAYGNRVNTGVYLVQGVSNDGQNHILTRMLIIN